VNEQEQQGEQAESTADPNPNEEPEAGSEGLTDKELNEQRAGEGEEPHEPESD
jgi:hypothetical protein